MCDFFSVTSDGLGNIAYFDWTVRQKILLGELDYIADSHTSINHYHGFKGRDEDFRNKYEFNPITGAFVTDKINSLDDSAEVERKVRALDFSKIVPELIIKPIAHPFKVKQNVVTDIDIENLHKWISVQDSVWDSVRNSVRSSVGNSVWGSVRNSARSSVGNSVWGSVWDSVGSSVWGSVWDFVWDSVWSSVGNSVWDAVGDSVWDSVGGYTSSFFKLEKWGGINHEPFMNPFQCLIDLWERGFVPSFDGKDWRLHSGAKAKIVYEEAE